MQLRVVDRLAEQAGGLDAALIAEPRTVQRGAHHELAHIPAGGEPLEPGDARNGIRGGIGDCDIGERLQAVGVHPDVRIGDPHRADRGVAQPRQRGGALARGLVHEAAGERAAALASLRDAAVRAVRVAGPWVWMHAYCLDALAGVAVADAAPDARDRVAELERVAARGNLRELVVRAALHRARLGDPSGVEAARLLGEAIDNPALHAELAAAV